jgi:hypothetical protein
VTLKSFIKIVNYYFFDAISKADSDKDDTFLEQTDSFDIKDSEEDVSICCGNNMVIHSIVNESHAYIHSFIGKSLIKYLTYSMEYLKVLLCFIVFHMMVKKTVITNQRLHQKI